MIIRKQSSMNHVLKGQQTLWLYDQRAEYKNRTFFLISDIKELNKYTGHSQWIEWIFFFISRSGQHNCTFLNKIYKIHSYTQRATNKNVEQILLYLLGFSLIVPKGELLFFFGSMKNFHIYHELQHTKPISTYIFGEWK